MLTDRVSVAADDASNVSKILLEYKNNVKELPQQSGKLIAEISFTSNILDGLKSSDLSEETLVVNAIERFTSLMREMVTHIEVHEREDENRLKWPFTELQNEEYFQKLEGFSQNFQNLHPHARSDHQFGLEGNAGGSQMFQLNFCVDSRTRFSDCPPAWKKFWSGHEASGEDWRIKEMNNVPGSEGADWLPAGELPNYHAVIPMSVHEKLIGNNVFGSVGTFKCDECRRRRKKCIYSDPNTPCRLCSQRNVQGCIKKPPPKRQLGSMRNDPSWTGQTFQRQQVRTVGWHDFRPALVVKCSEVVNELERNHPDLDAVDIFIQLGERLKNTNEISQERQQKLCRYLAEPEQRCKRMKF